MKNFIIKLTLILCSAFFLFSCSQSEKVTANKGPQYRYSKVYEGNRIIYRDLDKNDDYQRELKQGQTQQISKHPAEIDLRGAYASLDMEEEKGIPMQAGKSAGKAESQNLVKTFTSNFQQVHKSLATGGFLSKIRSKEHRTGVSNARADEDRSAVMGGGEIFAILGFAFGVIGFVGSGIGIAASILGLVFSILGLNSSLRIFAIIGLVVSAVSLAFAIF